MSQVAKLKKQAAEFEAKKQFDKAIGAYIKLLEAFDAYADELDIGLFNRVGDLLIRQGNVADAVDWYERGIDKYSDTGFFNNAIALCNKVLRHSPGRASIYYKLGRISAKKGFTNEARTNFLEYADRMQKAGKVDEAFRALTEFADLCPDQDEIRLTLAEQLTRAGRKADALEQLQILHERLDGEGRTNDARAVVDRMRLIDPAVEPRKSQSGGKGKSSELIFIDLDEPTFSQTAPGGVPIVTPATNTPPATAARGPSPAAASPAIASPAVTSPAIASPALPSQAVASPALASPIVASPIVASPAIATPPVPSPAVSPPVETTSSVPPRFSDRRRALSSSGEVDAYTGEEPPSFSPTPAHVEGWTTGREDTPPSHFDARDEGPAEPSEALDATESDAALPLDAAPSDDIYRSPADELEPPPDAVDESDGAVTSFDDDDVYRVVELDLQAAAAQFAPPDEISQVEAMDVLESEPLAEVEPEPEQEPEPEPLDESMEELLGDVIQSPAPVQAGEPSFPSPVLSPTLSVPAEPSGEELSRSTSSPALSGKALDNLPEQGRAAPTLEESIGMAITSSPTADSTSHQTRNSGAALIGRVEPTGAVEKKDVAPREEAIPGILLADALGGTVRRESPEDSPAILDETLDGEPIAFATPSKARRSTAVAAESVEALMASVQESPDNWGLHRDLGEAMLDAGDRDGGIRELECAMAGAERDGKLDLASSIAEEVARIEPEAVKHQQKRVEYAFRTNDRGRLIEAYLGLANVLLRTEQTEKARTIFQRVLDLAPDEPRARLALSSMTPTRARTGPSGYSPVTPAPRVSREHVVPSPRRSNGASVRPLSGSYVNLGDELRGDDVPRDTRMVVPEQEPTGDEQADFADMLRKFKAGIARNVAPEDHQSHYDLAIAYKEMGLVDEAIAEFQKALAGPTNRLPTYEALGQCFLEKEQFKLASSILSRALTENASEDQLVGILYLLGRAAELQGKADEALAYYQRVFVVDIQFRDIVDRMSEVEQALR